MRQPATKLEGVPAVAVQRMVRCITISNQLLDNLSVQKRLHGSRWRDVMADLGTALQLHMKATGETNPINAALPIAKKMSAAGENPMIFIAVATELANTPNDALNNGGEHQ